MKLVGKYLGHRRIGPLIFALAAGAVTWAVRGVDSEPAVAVVVVSLSTYLVVALIYRIDGSQRVTERTKQILIDIVTFFMP
ncbi:hypothetical protein [Haloarcula pelagica]|uniref:hypothetical protein n=1 Tax=Haloarcula pelagica TaxID=3033389 RepID=UPI0024C45081|nr:hypothetical protein [Halomicroarcula sp. YJ-61-S]